MAGKAFISMFICAYVFIDSFIAGKFFFLYVYLLLPIDSFIAGIALIFVCICSYVFIHWLQEQLLSLGLKERIERIKSVLKY